VLFLLLVLLAAYGAPAYITALWPEGWIRFLSRRGTTQGCPLGPFTFAAALHPVLRQVHAWCVWGGEPAPGQREVEGRGGAFWYEVPH
jgi:hypothetical protein